MYSDPHGLLVWKATIPSGPSVTRARLPEPRDVLPHLQGHFSLQGPCLASVLMLGGDLFLTQFSAGLDCGVGPRQWNSNWEKAVVSKVSPQVPSSERLTPMLNLKVTATPQFCFPLALKVEPCSRQLWAAVPGKGGDRGQTQGFHGIENVLA